MRIGVTRYLVLLLSDLCAASSIEEFAQAAAQRRLPKALSTKAWLSGAIAGHGPVPRARGRRELFDCLTAALSENPAAAALRLTDAANAHLKDVYVSMEDVRGSYRTMIERAGGAEKAPSCAHEHYEKLSEWREQLSAWCAGLEKLPADYPSATLFKRIFLALTLSEVCSDLADMRVDVVAASGPDPALDEARRSLYNEASDALGAVSQLLHKVQRDFPTPNLLLRVDTNIMVAIAGNLPYSRRFGNVVLAQQWKEFQFKERLSAGPIVSSLLLRTLIELAMYAHLPDPRAKAPATLVQDWKCFDRMLEARFARFANGNRKILPDSWKAVGYPAIADDKRLGPYMSWLGLRTPS